MLCAPLTYTRRHFVPNRRPPFYPELVLCQTLALLFVHTTHIDCLNQFIFYCVRWYWSLSMFGESYNCPLLCTRGFVTLSFLALPTSQLLCLALLYSRFCFVFSTRVENWVICRPCLIVGLNDPVIKMPVRLWSFWLWWGCFEMVEGYLLAKDKDSIVLKTHSGLHLLKLP